MHPDINFLLVKRLINFMRSEELSGIFKEGILIHSGSSAFSFALISPNGVVTSFICMECPPNIATAIGGPAEGHRPQTISANGLTSHTYQLFGSGTCYEDFFWRRAASSFGHLNLDQSSDLILLSPPVSELVGDMGWNTDTTFDCGAFNNIRGYEESQDMITKTIY